MEILPIKSLTDEDSQIFGGLNVSLGKLARIGLSVGSGIVITSPELKLKTVLEHYDFGVKEVFEQSLSLVRKEINAIPVPEILQKETKSQKRLYLNGEIIKSTKDLWQMLLDTWLEEIKGRLWKDGFYLGVTANLQPQIVIFTKKLEGFGKAYFDLISDEVIVTNGSKLHPVDLKKIDELVKTANKKLFIPHEYEWILDGSIKIVKVLPYTPITVIASEAWQSNIGIASSSSTPRNDKLSTIKVFLDMSKGLVVDSEVDGVYIAAEKIFDLNKPQDSFENLVSKLVESANTFPNSPILFKLADQSEGMGKVRGTLRLLHQKSLLDPMIQALDFARHKKGLTNVHVVIPFVRGVSEFLKIKRELAVKKLMRKNSLELWLEVAIPENILNLEDYLVAGLDGIVLNLDELISHVNGFDTEVSELMFYKNEVSGLLKFLEDSLKILHKSKKPFIAYGSLSLYPQVLDFLIEKGVQGVVIEKYEAPSIHQLLNSAEKRMILRKSS